MSSHATDFILKEKERALKARISLDKLVKTHNHEIWRKCICGNEEDLRKTYECSVCGNKIFIPSKN